MMLSHACGMGCGQPCRIAHLQEVAATTLRACPRALLQEIYTTAEIVDIVNVLRDELQQSLNRVHVLLASCML